MAAEDIQATAETTTDGAGTSVAQAGTTLKYGGKDYANAEELGKAYEAAQSELGRWTQQYGDLKKQHETTSETAKKWSDWWQTVQPLWGEDVETLLRQKLNGGQQGRPQARATEQQASAAQAALDGYEMLSPQDQATRLRQVILEDLGQQANAWRGDLVKAIQQEFENKEKWYQSYLSNHLGLMRRALENKIKDPNFNVDAVMEQAVRAIGGQIDPIQLGQQLLSAAEFDSRLDAAKKESYAQGKRDFEEAQKNKAMEQVPMSFSSPVYKIPSSAKDTGVSRGLASRREQAAQNIMKKFGPSWFSE